ncbi:MAG: hypothetical protein ACK40U_03870 [Fervidobacterium pennivorans]
MISWTEDGKPLWMFGTHTEITKVKETALALKESNAFVELEVTLFSATMSTL